MYCKITGCELEKLPDGTVKSLTVFDEYGFDGEDFIAFNSDPQQWIDKNPKAEETKREWDQQTERNQFLQHYLQTSCFLLFFFSHRDKTKVFINVCLLIALLFSSPAPPDVHVFVKKAPDQSKLVLSCLATGFYPRDIEMNIRLDETVLEKQTSSGIRPNADGSFQMRSSVKIDANHKGSYDCLVIHSSLTQTRPVLTVWTINHQTFNEPLWSVIAGIAAALKISNGKL
uniref:Ig-like domain-containing protein n=1 Tax=Sinocyclocheilus rhinocerous TaxID=307959 RepID=A0A673FLZ3_9TELE